MINKKVLRLYAVLLATLQLPLTAWAADAEWFVEDRGNIAKPNESVNINPWNVASIGGSAKAELVNVDGSVKIELDYPLYKLSDGYSDKIIQKDGLWGVERNVETIIFDGSEDWEEYKQPGYLNSSTVIFSCSAPKEYKIQNGKCTHFDVLLDKDQKNCIYDGISFGREKGTILMRFMNVRGIKDTNALKAYLKGQADAGRPVKLLYPALKSTFTPFSDEIQDRLKKTDILGYIADGALELKKKEEAVLPKDIFKTGSGNAEADAFLTAVTSVSIQNAGSQYFVEGIYPEENGVAICVEDTSGNEYRGTLTYSETDFLSPKASELVLEGKDGNIYVKMNLSKARLPQSSLGGLKAEFSDDCTKTKELVVVDHIPVAENHSVPFYAGNAVLYGGSDDVAVDGAENNRIGKENIRLMTQNEERTIEVIPVKYNKKLEVLFLGDSLINQNYYTEAVKELFGDGRLTLLGTRGEGENRHEGRGGWSAYDYCCEQEKYGCTNAFMHDGEFDFKYYMESNGYKNVDVVVLNLGINDLNLAGHNTHAEILKYFSKIIDKIHEFDPQISILINMPTIPYENEVTGIYKNERLELSKSLIEAYSGREGIFLVPLYLSISQEQGYKYTEPVIDEFNQDYGLVVRDTTHPAISGYEQMAEMTYGYIQYAALKSGR